MDIRRLPIIHPDAARLVEEVQQEYVARYGGRDESPLDPDAFEGERGAFFVGYLEGRPVATGAWRRRRSVSALGVDEAAEIKRMYVVAGARRAGLAGEMLAHLERTATEAGADVMVLETGTAQPEAIAFYAAAGYESIDNYGHYRDAPEARSFGRRLVLPGQREWDAEAAAFDSQPDHGLADPATRAAWRDLLAELLPPAPARVVDLGCGTGSLAVLLAEQGYAVTGLDASPQMLALARAKAADAGVELDLRHGDANTPDLEPAAYDVVLDRHVLWAMTDPADAVRHWAGLLAPSGVMALVEGTWHTGAGLEPDHVADLVTAAGLTPTLRDLPDPLLWGGETGDRRYVVAARDSDGLQARSATMTR